MTTVPLDEISIFGSDSEIIMVKLGFPKRSHLQVVQDILVYCQRSTRKTHIMYGCNLSYQQLQKYLGLLVDAEFLRATVDHGGRMYSLTDSGREYVGHYRDLAPMLEKIWPQSDPDKRFKSEVLIGNTSY